MEFHLLQFSLLLVVVWWRCEAIGSVDKNQ